MRSAADEKAARALLDWYRAMGVDEAVGEEPFDSFAAAGLKPAPRSAPELKMSVSPPRVAPRAAGATSTRRIGAEVSTLMMLLKRYLRSELNTLLRNNIKFKVVGRMEDLAPDVQRELRDAEQRTATNAGMQFNIALNYGGRAEIVEAARRMLADGVAPDQIDEPRFASYLYTAGQPDPDLLIRTSGEMRVSNFLLWQIAYAEIWVTDTLWPDFRRRDLLQAVLAYQKRDRRYGGIKQTPVALSAK